MWLKEDLPLGFSKETGQSETSIHSSKDLKDVRSQQMTAGRTPQAKGAARWEHARSVQGIPRGLLWLQPQGEEVTLER